MTDIIRGSEFALKSLPTLCQCCGENPSVQRVIDADMNAMCGLGLPVRRYRGAMKFIWFTGEICAECLHDYYVPEEKFLEEEHREGEWDRIVRHERSVYLRDIV